jgi:hypothetical protein
VVLAAGMAAGRFLDAAQVVHRHPQRGEDGVRHEVRAAEGADAERGVGVGPHRVVDLGDDLPRAEHLDGQLAGHGVAVVPLRQGQEDVGILGTGPAEHVLVGPVAADGAAPERAREAIERPGLRIQDQDLVAGRVERLGEHRPDPTAADDHGFHAASSGIGSRTTHTAHGAFLSTYGITRPMAKSPPKRRR